MVPRNPQSNATGRLKFEYLESKALKDNPLGDPHVREAIVYTPPGYDPDKRYPVVYCLPGHTGTARKLVTPSPPFQPITYKMDSLIQSRKCGKMLLVMVDCFNSLGGSQYINSDAVGDYADYVIKELIPFIEGRYKCGRRALLGSSSGGYGSFVLGMKHPNLFSSMVIHAGDCGFEYCYQPFFQTAYAELKKAGGVTKWLNGFWERDSKPIKEAISNAEHKTLGILCFAAHYSPDPNAEKRIGLPFRLDTGELDYAVWEKWLAHDPVQLIDKNWRAFKRYEMISLDVGSKDEYNIQIGSAILHEKFKRYGIRHDWKYVPEALHDVKFRDYDILPRLERELRVV